MIAILLTLLARVLLLAIVAWCAYAAACIGAQAWRHATLLSIPSEDEEDDDDPGAEWDRARDRDLDYRSGVA